MCDANAAVAVEAEESLPPLALLLVDGFVFLKPKANASLSGSSVDLARRYECPAFILGGRWLAAPFPSALLALASKIEAVVASTH